MQRLRRVLFGGALSPGGGAVSKTHRGMRCAALEYAQSAIPLRCHYRTARSCKGSSCALACSFASRVGMGVGPGCGALGGQCSGL